MKRARACTIAQRRAQAQRRGEFIGNLVMALIPLFNGIYYAGAGWRLAALAEQRGRLRLLYLALAVVLVLLPVLAFRAGHWADENPAVFYATLGVPIWVEIGPLAAITSYLVIGLGIAVLHSRISAGLEAPQV